MTLRQFVFSHNSSRRLFRHLIFWMSCFFFFQLSYWLPTYWYPAWNTNGVISPIMQGPLGFPDKCLLILLYSLLCMSFFMIFTYPLLYFLLSRYLMRGSYVYFGVSVLVLLVITTVVVFYGFVYISPMIQHHFGWTGKDPRSTAQLIQCAFDITLFNCPTIGGLAVGIKLLKDWYLRQEKTTQLITSKANAELQLLKAQVHPHFLFNTLNNIYAFTLSSSPKAPVMVKKLSGLLRYIIYECSQNVVSLKKELEMIRDYMDLEKIRYEDQIAINIDIRGSAEGKMIAPLILIPFVENCFKHGTSKMLSKSWINLTVNIDQNKFYLFLDNSKPPPQPNVELDHGIGLDNVRKRLTLLYPDSHTIKIAEENERFKVQLVLDLDPVESIILNSGNKKKVNVHEFA